MRTESAESSLLELRFLGACDVRVQGEPLPALRYRKDLWLLALLALRHGRAVARGELAALFWPDAEESQALYSLRRSLSNLRRALGVEAHRILTPSPHTLRLDLSDTDCDFLAFDAALTQAAACAAPEEPLQQAVSLYRGPLLPGCLEEWALPERSGREQAYLAALERLARISQEKGEHSAAVRRLRMLLAADPYRESACCALMQALSDCGDKAAVTQVYRDLRLLLHRDLNAQPAPETDALYQSLHMRQAPLGIRNPPNPPALLPSDTFRKEPPRHLPVPLSDLIGREKEVEEVGVWLDRCRLVTLVGTGGVGKTRLSIAAAERVIGHFSGGVWFVDLAPLGDAVLLTQTVLRQLDIREELFCKPEDTLEQALSSRTMLLVIDNCEHLLEPCASLIHRLLSACPGLRVLATSREALQLTGEHLYPVPALSLPPPRQAGKEKATFSLLEYEAVQLFVERARQSRPAFRLTHGNAELVVQICHRLDGIPLAIELAAVRVRSLPLAQIAGRLEDRFHLLAGKARDTLPRQQTLRALIDWSYDMLAEQEKTLLRRLSVFAGGWSLAAATVVFGGDAQDTIIEDWEVLDLLASLVNKSLVVYEEGADGEARYRLLETIRYYCHERLKENGEEKEAYRRHRNFFLALAEEAEPQLLDAYQQNCVKRLQAEADNLRAALTQSQGDTQASLRLVGALRMYWIFTNVREGQTHAATALSLPGAEGRTAARAKALTATAGMSDPAEARSYLKEGLSIARELGDELLMIWALLGSGDTASSQGKYQTAYEFLTESLALCRTAGYWPGLLWALNYLGINALRQGHAAEAREYWERAVAPAREGHWDSRICWTLNSLANLNREECEQGKALALAKESLALVRAAGIKTDLSWTAEIAADLHSDQGEFEEARSLLSQAEAFRKAEGWEEFIQPQILMVRACLGLGEYEAAQEYLKLSLGMAASTEEGWLRQYQGDTALGYHDKDTARLFYRDSLRVFWERQDMAGVFLALSGLSATEETERSARLHGAVIALSQTDARVSRILKPHERQRQMYENAATASRVALGEAVFTIAFEAGRAMTLEQAGEFALSSG